MAATAEKARYFLEQSVPELKELEQKKIFTQVEVSSIAKKRSDFEHKINARGSDPNDYIKYAQFEMNVEMLRKKRVKRLAIKYTTHNGQRRVFFILDRGTRKFPGDMDLWMESIRYARQQKANKKVAQILTNALRMHPTKPQLWIFAASWAMEDKADVSEARSYMQRGLRFTKSATSIWIEYARLELGYVGKVHARRQILGVGEHTRQDETLTEGDDDENIMHLPRLTAEDIEPDRVSDIGTDDIVVRNLANTPVMSGAIPIAIFDAAMVQFKNDIVVAHQFFDALADFDQVPTTHKVLQHILQRMQSISDRSWHTAACNVAKSSLGLSTDNPNYLTAVREFLQLLDQRSTQCSDKAVLLEWCKKWLDKQLANDLDPAIETILRSKRANLD